MHACRDGGLEGGGGFEWEIKDVSRVSEAGLEWEMSSYKGGVVLGLTQIDFVFFCL